MSASLLNPGWLHSVLRARGLPLLPVERLREAVAQLRPEQAAALRQACMALQSGTDSMAQMSQLADFVRLSRPEHGDALRTAGLSDDVGDLLAALEALGGQALFDALRALPEPMAIETLRAHLQPVAEPVAATAPDAVSGPSHGWPESDLDFDDDEAPPPWTPPEAAGLASPTQVEAVPARAAPLHPSAARVLPRGHHVYGAKAALRVEEDRWRTDDPVRCHTLRLEVAPALGERRYDWEHKIAVQLTARELPSFAAVMLNLLPQLQAQGHGVLNDKWLECRRQAGSVLVRVGQGRRGCAIPVAAGDLYELTLLALDALKANAPQADTAQVMAALQSLAG
ncbi:hypothetical protein [uncultured Azohydromonas sp.]|jgi:Whirly transcription factor.|uniref:hypothetical protein n=1 Tax=uncultured Azohydromonas sp. TaxID=487342 RepID=UPI0026369795|nr:hypothetical protein [uncultured Azohydromonas sp.]